jgi:transcriptional regulator with XRE-family HTH domain
MSTEFGNYLKELRTKKHYEIEDIATRLKFDSKLISSWEDGSNTPSRGRIINISEVMNLEVEEINKLLGLSNEVKLATYEIASIYPYKPYNFDVSIPEMNEWLKTNTYNSAAIGSTIGTLETKLGSVQANLAATIDIVKKENVSMKDIEAIIEPISTELQGIKEEYKLKFETIKKVLDKSNEFVENHLEIFRSAVNGEGIIKDINNKQNLFENRLVRLEDQVYKSKDRIITIIMLIVTVAALGVAIIAILKH